MQNWKDAVRSSIQLSYRGNATAPLSSQQGGRRNLMSAISENSHDHQNTPSDAEMDPNNLQLENSHQSSERRLTRSAFTKTLQEREMGMAENNDGESSMLPSGVNARHRNSVFDVRGLARLRETFSAIDNSVKEVRMEESKEGNGAGINILHPADVSAAIQ